MTLLFLSSFYFERRRLILGYTYGVRKMIEETDGFYNQLHEAIPRKVRDGIDQHITQFSREVLYSEYYDDKSVHESDQNLIGLYNSCESQIIELVEENYSIITMNLNDHELSTAELISYIAIRMMQLEPYTSLLTIMAYRQQQNHII